MPRPDSSAYDNGSRNDSSPFQPPRDEADRAQREAGGDNGSRDASRDKHPAPRDQPQHGNSSENGAQARDEHQVPKDLPMPSTTTIVIAACIMAGLLAALFLVGLIPHLSRQREVKADAAEGSKAPTVSVVRPKVGAPVKDVILPADVKANQETALFPRANGYLKTLHCDIGDKVKAGDLLAEIETPDVDAQLAQSRASVEQSKANVKKSESDLALAKSTLDRFEGLARAETGGVTEQELDEKRSAFNQASSTLAAARANVVAAEADVQRLAVLQGFEKVIAPFSGTITARNYDVGALLSSGGGGKEMFRIAETDVLRVFVNVPQSYSTNVKTGQPAFLSVRNFPGREFEGTVSRTAGAIDLATRTLSVELLFKNDGSLYPGMYGQARVGVVEAKPTLTIPTSAVVFNASGLRVALVRDGKVKFQNLSVGRDLGTEIVVASGLSEEDELIDSPSSQLVEGADVTVNKPSAGPAVASTGGTEKPSQPSATATPSEAAQK